MGLGVIKVSSYSTKYSVPLFSGDDTDWQDNTWIVEHLRQLATEIEEQNISILNVSIVNQKPSKIPTLEIEFFNSSLKKDYFSNKLKP